MEEFINTDKNNTEIDGVLESSLKDFLEDMLSYLEKFIVSKEEIEEIEKKLFDYANLNELCDIMRNIFSSLKEKIDRKLKKFDKSSVSEEEIAEEDYVKLEKILQKHEGEIRNHISIEQQLRLCAESLQSKVEETEKLKSTISESTKQTITNLSKEKNDLLKKIQIYQIENENLKKLVTIKDNKEKELLKKIEEYPFLQQKLRALESILKNKKQFTKFLSLDKIEKIEEIQNNSSKKKDCETNSPLEKSRVSNDSRKTSREKPRNSFHQSGSTSKDSYNLGNFQEYLKMKINSKSKEKSKDKKLVLNNFPLFKLPKHPVLNKKSIQEEKKPPQKISSEIIIGEKTVLQPGNVNINFTNLTNSLIVTQQDPNHSKISISKKIPITANHRKTKSHGGAGKIFPVKQGLIENFTKTGNQFYNLKGQK